MRIFLLVIALYAPVLAAEPLADWSNSDKWLLGTAIGLMASDWGQSRDIAKRTTNYYTTPACADPETRRFAEPCQLASRPAFHETNPLLPAHPSVAQVDRYFALAMGASGIAAAILPTQQRRWLLGGIVVMETVVVLRNHRVGVRFSF